VTHLRQFNLVSLCGEICRRWNFRTLFGEEAEVLGGTEHNENRRCYVGEFTGMFKFKPFLFLFSLIQSHSHRSGSSTFVATYMVLRIWRIVH
jgi:hypothetical protein